MAHTDWIPTIEGELVALIREWVKMLEDADKIVAFGWEAEVCAAVNIKLKAFLQAYAAYCRNDTSRNAFIKAGARKTAEAVMRVFANTSVRWNTLMPDEDKQTLGIRPRKTGNRRRSNPLDYVGFHLHTDPKDHRVIGDFFIDGDDGRGKGPYHAMEVRYWLRGLYESPPIDPNDAGWCGETITASPWEMVLRGADAGKCLYVTMRWLNGSTGKSGHTGRGPWAAIQSIITQ
jgi:hypothetical protein